MQSLPLAGKVVMTQQRIREWYEYWNGEVYVSFSGGKDSTVLLHLVREMYPDVPAVFSDTGLEFPEIREFVKTIPNVTWLKPDMTFRKVLEKYGYPVIGKEQSKWIDEARRGSAEGQARRLYGIRGVAKKSTFRISDQWHYLMNAPFKISDECCNEMKKKPMKRYAHETGRVPIIGTMAEESKLRTQHWLQEGCNAFDAKRPTSKPMSFWTEADVWQYIRENNIPYSKIYDMGYARTGCIFCMFGAHYDGEPTRFQRLQRTHPKLWRYCISVANVLVEDKRARMVIDLDYTAREGASVVFHGEIKHKITLTPEPESSEGGGEGETPATSTIKIPKEATIAVTYYVNGDEVTEYYPVDMETAGTHLLHLQYFWDVAEDTLDGDFQVWIRMDGAKMDIKAGDARGYLMGQGLAADELDKSLRYIYIATLPTTRDYLEGSYMDYTGLVVMAMYKDGTTEDITGLVTLAPENGAKLETVGEVPCVVTYTDEDGNAYRDGFSVTVTPKVLESIVITSLPTKLEYVLGQPYDYTGLEVTAFYNNNTSEVVTDRCTITPAEGTDTDAAGEIPVLVSFTKDDVTQTADFNVNVLVLDHIEITTPPDVTEFTEDDPYDYTGVEITAYFEDGTTWDVTEDCTFSPAPGSTATTGTDTVTVTYAPSAVSQATATFPITVKEKPKKKVRAIQLLATTYEDSLARIRSVLSIPNKMLQRIEAKRQSVFGGASLNIVLAAGYCNYKGSGSTRYVLMDITPWVGTDKYLYEFIDPAYGISQGVQIPSDYPSYREFYPHQYIWENCTGNNMFFIVGSEGELQQDEGWTTPFLSDLILGFGSDVYNYNPFSQSGKQSYQALAANYLIVEVDDPNP